MRNWIVSGFLSASILNTAGTAHALPSDIGDTYNTFNECFVNYKANGLAAFVAVFDNGPIPYHAGGTTWFENRVGTGGYSLSTEKIASCLGVLENKITNFSQTGATAASYEEESYIGFSFSLGEGTPYAAGTYEYFIGTSENTDRPTQNQDLIADLSPTVTLTSIANNPHSGVFTVTATFSNDVTGFAFDSPTVENGSLSNFAATSASVYTFDVTPTADGAVTVDVATDIAQDSAARGNAAATQLSVTTDGTAPTVALTSNANDPQSGVFTVTATFSEAVTGLTADEIVVVNGTKGTLSGSGTTYTIEVTPDADGPVTVVIAADVAADDATNGNTAATQLSVTTDGTAPTVALTSNANDPHSGVFTVTATFSEAVTGFVIGDVVVGNGSASNFDDSFCISLHL